LIVGSIYWGGYDSNDNITSIADLIDDSRSIFYGYDVNDRMTRTLLTAGTVQSGTDSYSYAAGKNQLSSIANAAGTRSFGYDGRGNLTSESRPGSVSATPSYDAYGRLTGYARTDIGTLSFVYNMRDDRVAMTSGTGTRRFVYDADGRVIGEYGASAADVKAEFIWAQPEVANDNALFGGDDGAGSYMPLPAYGSKGFIAAGGGCGVSVDEPESRGAAETVVTETGPSRRSWTRSSDRESIGALNRMKHPRRRRPSSRGRSEPQSMPNPTRHTASVAIATPARPSKTPSIHRTASTRPSTVPV